MANGASAPNYRLSQGTQRRVYEAGVDPVNAKSGKTARQHLTNAAIAGEISNIATGVKDQIVAKQEDTAARENAWETGFDAMGDRGSWASGELYDQFQTMENEYKDKYLEAVRKGDKKEQARMLKDQATRASGLKGWKETMETAKKINDGVGWSNTFKGDTESLQIMNALTTLDGKTAVTRFGENGEMVFDVKIDGPPAKTVTKTRREIDDMIAKGVKPVKQELDFMNGLLSYQEKGASGGIFNEDIVKRENELVNIKDEDIPALIREDFGGGGTFADHIKTHPEMIAQFADVIGNGDTIVTSEEKEALDLLINDDMNAIISAMEANPKVAKKYLADWKTAQEKAAFDRGRGVYDEAEYHKGLSRFKKGSLEQRNFIWAHDANKAIASGDYATWLDNNPKPE